jgi:hypothetical protein
MPIYYQGKELGNMEVNQVDYVLPAATDSVFGGVKIGDNINVDEDGTISIDRAGGWRLINTVEITEEIRTIEITEDSEGNPFAVKELHIIGEGITAKESMSIYLCFNSSFPWYTNNAQVGAFDTKAEYWDFYTFPAGIRSYFSCINTWNTGALNYIRGNNNDIPNDTISYIRFMAPYTESRFTAGKMTIYGR